MRLETVSILVAVLNIGITVLNIFLMSRQDKIISNFIKLEESRYDRKSRRYR